MRNLLILFVISLSPLYAMSWQDQWAEGLKAIDQDRLVDAKLHLDLAIDADSDVDILIDRGVLFNQMQQYELAEQDFTLALDSGRLSKEAEWRAYGERCISRSSLGDERGMDDLKRFGEICPLVPKKIEGKKKIILKNVPDSECYHKTMTCFYIHTGQCSSKHDIEKTSTGDWIIHKTCDCGCKPKPEKRTCDACGSELSCSKATDVAICKRACTMTGIAANDWCGRYFGGSFQCRMACLASVYEMSDICWWCCEGGDFYGKCIQPLKLIKDSMGASCIAEIRDAWDD